RGDVGLAALTEGHRPSGIELSFRFCLLAQGQRLEGQFVVPERIELLAPLRRPFARLGQWHTMVRSEPHFAQAAIDAVSKDPTLSAAGGDLKVQPTAVAEMARLLGLRDGCGRQLSKGVRAPSFASHGTFLRLTKPLLRYPSNGSVS